MAILLDEPRWARHGTQWAHLVSDVSLSELHTFAAAVGLPSRSFDLDHYDVPADRWAELLAAGAEPVSCGELIRRLRASGLRVPAVERPAKRREALLEQWAELLPTAGELGRRLLARWEERHRHYHDLRHLHAMLTDLHSLNEAGEPVSREVWLAAWFHDAVWQGRSPDDERASAELAYHKLREELGDAEAGEVARLIRLTAEHGPEPTDTAGALLCDADLAILAAPPKRYRRYTDDVRQEYRHVADDVFIAGRLQVLTTLLERENIYTTITARIWWEQRARQNLRAEQTMLADTTHRNATTTGW